MAQDLCVSEREEIRACLVEDEGMSFAEIARRLGRDRSTVSREVTRNGGRRAYRAHLAQRRRDRQRLRPRTAVLETDVKLAGRVGAELGDGRSPYAIAVGLRADPAVRSLCHETIYQGIYRGILGQDVRKCLRTRRVRRRRRRRGPEKPAVKLFSTIALRPRRVRDREEVGHWEADLIIGARNASAMLFAAERVSRFAIGCRLSRGYRADLVCEALQSIFDQVPAHMLRSLTLDQGSEWANWG